MAQKCRNWCFTMFEWDTEVIKSLTGHRHIRCQEEVSPTTGKHHLQGVISFSNQRHMGGVKKWLRSKNVHLEQMKGTYKQAYDYCCKSDSKDASGFEYESGELPDGQGCRNDLNSIVKLLVNKTMTLNEVMIEYPDIYCRYRNGLRDIYSNVCSAPRNFKSHVTVYYGGSGSGKSMKAFECDNPYVLRCSKTGVWWDGYTNNDTVIIDDFYGWIPFNMLLNLLDRYAMKVDIKGGAMEFNSKNIIITSNKSPLDWYPNLSDEHKYALLRRIDNVEYFERKMPVKNLNDNLRKVLGSIAESPKRAHDPLLDFGSEVLQKGNTIPFVEAPVTEDDEDEFGFSLNR